MISGLDNILRNKAADLAREFQAQANDTNNLCLDFDRENALQELKVFEQNLKKTQSDLNKQMMAQWLYEDLRDKTDLNTIDLKKRVDEMMYDYDNLELTFASEVEELLIRSKLSHEESKHNMTDSSSKASVEELSSDEPNFYTPVEYLEHWSSHERSRYFEALALYSAQESARISQYIGTQKTSSDVAAYTSVLQAALDKLRSDPETAYLTHFSPAHFFPSAREVPPELIEDENLNAHFNNIKEDFNTYLDYQGAPMVLNEQNIRKFKLFNLDVLWELSKGICDTKEAFIPPSLPLKLHRILYKFLQQVIEQMLLIDNESGSKSPDSTHANSNSLMLIHAGQENPEPTQNNSNDFELPYVSSARYPSVHDSSFPVMNVTHCTVYKALNDILQLSNSWNIKSIFAPQDHSDIDSSKSAENTSSTDSSNYIEILSDSSSQDQEVIHNPDSDVYSRPSNTPEMDDKCIIISDSDEYSRPITVQASSPERASSAEKDSNTHIEPQLDWAFLGNCLADSDKFSVIAQEKHSECFSSQSSASPPQSHDKSSCFKDRQHFDPHLPIYHVVEDLLSEDEVFHDNDPVLTMQKRKLSISTEVLADSPSHHKKTTTLPSPPSEASINSLDLQLQAKRKVKHIYCLTPPHSHPANTTLESSEADLDSDDPEELQEKLYDSLYIDTFLYRGSN
ncbi:hypothetical protein DSO57_1005124 [Entomophthora muscae]|uniref:Uncharacterized protein n=1 Tax=Entomophthora muscae TaxID=34485 RepID=A0ACC2SA88_9FUNG|nr:hypothetical protein DSO57_1005124 [Entomophthora muscae]